jgi:hypothetical protein
MPKVAAGYASLVDVGETPLQALAPADRHPVRYGSAARLYGLRRLADASAPAA